MLKWSSFSPDLHRIEQLWHELERKMKKYQPKNKDELKQYLLQEWLNIGREVTGKLVNSVLNCLYKCLRMKGIPCDTKRCNVCEVYPHLLLFLVLYEQLL